MTDTRQEIDTILIHRMILGIKMEDFWRWWSGMQECQHLLTRWELTYRSNEMKDLVESSMSHTEALYK